MDAILSAIFSAIIRPLIGPILAWLQKRRADNQAEAVSNEQQHLDTRAGVEASELEKVRSDAAASTGRDADGELRDDSAAVQSTIDRANGKLP